MNNSDDGVWFKIEHTLATEELERARRQRDDARQERDAAEAKVKKLELDLSLLKIELILACNTLKVSRYYLDDSVIEEVDAAIERIRTVIGDQNDDPNLAE